VHALKNRPEIRSLPPRESLVELLLRYSLNQKDKLYSLIKNVSEAKNILSILDQIKNPNAIVEDSSEATLRIYSVIASIDQNDNASQWQDISDQLNEEFTSIDESEVFKQLSSDQSDTSEENDYEKMQDVEYRGDFKPEIGQLITDIQSQLEDPQEEDSDKITQEMLQSALDRNADIQGDDSNDLSDGLKAMIQKLSMEMMNQEQFHSDPNKKFSDQSSNPDLSDNDQSLEIKEEGSFLYDEWDFKVGDFRVDWCLVKEKLISEGTSEYYDQILHEYSSMVTKIKRQFEQITPEMYRKVRKLDDGEEIDIDDVIEAMIDIKSGVGPSEKLYWKRNKVQRDVAVLFLLDTSASTAEAISDISTSYAVSGGTDVNVSRSSYKRIIDVEKEAVVLLINAIESLGDIYGIYGFSGYGRENVEFYTVKDIDEPFSEKIKGRVESISPLHATRMGPAIRHATTKLDKVDARTKLLFLISDGRPQDRGYSREGVEKEYGVHDTKMALDEAKNKNINAFCLTVDKTGHDYLKTMCQDMAYEVLDDIHILPERLLYLYRRLTT
jgi:nitric oxide reductase activation protein